MRPQSELLSAFFASPLLENRKKAAAVWSEHTTVIALPSTMQPAHESNTYASPLRVDLMDAATRQLVRDLIQSHLVSYHEDEHGNPKHPSRLHAPARAQAAASGTSLHRPARGLVTLLPRPDADARHKGMRALLQISADGQLTMWGSNLFDVILLDTPLCKLSVSFFEDPARQNMLVLSAAQVDSAEAHTPAIVCVVRNRSKWLAIFSRHSATPHPYVEREAEA